MTRSKQAVKEAKKRVQKRKKKHAEAVKNLEILPDKPTVSQCETYIEKLLERKMCRKTPSVKEDKFALELAKQVESGEKVNLVKASRDAGYVSDGSAYILVTREHVVERVAYYREVLRYSNLDSKNIALSKINKELMETTDVDNLVKLTAELRKTQGWGKPEDVKTVPEELHIHFTNQSVEETVQINKERNVTEVYSKDGKPLNTNEEASFEKAIIIDIENDDDNAGT